MRVLLTGADGQLGQAIQTEFRDHQVVPSDLPELDITDLAGVRNAIDRHRPDAVINAAAYTNVDGAEENSLEAYRVNALGARTVAVATAEAGIPIVQISTDYVFDGELGRPYHELDTPRPLSVYGSSKLAGEVDVRRLNERHYIVRTAWLYHTIGRNFALTILALARKGDVRVVNDQRGSPTYAPHLARALAELLVRGTYGTYHLAGQGGASWYQLTVALFEKLGTAATVVPVTTAEFPRPARRPRNSELTSRVEPRIVLPPWEDGTEEFARELAR